MISLKKFTPSDFARKPRPFAELKHFKATEFRLFVLYIGPVVLKGVLDPPKFKHFMLFHSAIYIMASRASIDKEWVEYAGALLDQFVEECESLYFREILTYNMHSLKHLSSDVLMGP